jgi:ankyrin repeat protein
MSDGIRPLHHAARNPNNEAAMTATRLLIGAGADVSDCEETGSTVLHYAACISSSPELIAFLIEAGADPTAKNRWGNLPIYAAAINFKAGGAIAAELLKSSAVRERLRGSTRIGGCHLMHYVAQNDDLGEMTTLVRLLAQHADINAKDDEGRTPLLHALLSKSGHQLERVRVFLAAGADVNVKDNKGTTALHRAIHEENEDIVIELLAAGADVHAEDTHKGIVYRPIHFAKTERETRALVAAGADVDVQDSEGLRPLHNAVIHGCNEAVRALVEAGAHPNFPDFGGRRPLHYAKKKDTALLLLRLGASLSIANDDGTTAATEAAGGNKRIQDALLKCRNTLPCKTCGSSVRVLRCSRCLSVCYCNVSCQTADWKNHKLKCRSVTPP